MTQTYLHNKDILEFHGTNVCETGSPRQRGIFGIYVKKTDKQDFTMNVIVAVRQYDLETKDDSLIFPRTIKWEDVEKGKKAYEIAFSGKVSDFRKESVKDIKDEMYDK